MEFLQQDSFDLVLGWEFYVPLIFALVMIAFAVPIWAVLGVTWAMLHMDLLWTRKSLNMVAVALGDWNDTPSDSNHVVSCDEQNALQVHSAIP